MDARGAFVDALQIAAVQDLDDIVQALEDGTTTMDDLRCVAHAPHWVPDDQVLSALTMLTTQEKQFPVYLVLKTSEQVIIEALQAYWCGKPVSLKAAPAKVWAAYQAKPPEVRPFHLYKRPLGELCYDPLMCPDDEYGVGGLNPVLIQGLASEGRLFPLDEDWLLVFSTPQPTIRQAIQLVHSGAPVRDLLGKKNETHVFEVNSTMFGCTNRTKGSRTWTLYHIKQDTRYRTLKVQVSPLYLPGVDPLTLPEQVSLHL